LPFLKTIAETVEREYYDLETPRRHYPVVVMLKLLVIRCFRGFSYARTTQLLTPEIPLLHPAMLHHFVKHRLRWTV
jgi:hypothetical protein